MKSKILLITFLSILYINLFSQNDCKESITLYGIVGEGADKTAAVENAKQNAIVRALRSNYLINTMGNGYKKQWIIDDLKFKTDIKFGFIGNISAENLMEFSNEKGVPNDPTKRFKFWEGRLKNIWKNRSSLDSALKNIVEYEFNKPYQCIIKEITVCTDNVEKEIDKTESLFSLFKFTIFFDTLNYKKDFKFIDKSTGTEKQKALDQEHMNAFYSTLMTKVTTKGFYMVELSEYKQKLKAAQQEPWKSYYDKLSGIFQPNEIQKIGYYQGVDFIFLIKNIKVEKSTRTVGGQTLNSVKAQATISAILTGENKNFYEKIYYSKEINVPSEYQAIQEAFADITKQMEDKAGFFDVFFNTQVKDMIKNGFPIVGYYEFGDFNLQSADFTQFVGENYSKQLLSKPQVTDLTSNDYRITYRYKEDPNDFKKKMLDLVRSNYGQVYTNPATPFTYFLSTKNYFAGSGSDKKLKPLRDTTVNTNQVTFKIKVNKPQKVTATNMDNGEDLKTDFKFVATNSICFVTVKDLSSGINKVLIDVYPHGSVEVNINCLGGNNNTNTDGLPIVTIISPSKGSSVKEQEVELIVQVVSNEQPTVKFGVENCGSKSGVGNPFDDEDNTKPTNNVYTFKEKIMLKDGCNMVRVTANNSKGQGEDNIKLNYDGGKTNGGNTLNNKLYVFSVGVSEFQNKGLNLKYAANDANDITTAFQNQEGKIFKTVEVNKITNSLATKATILSQLDAISGKVTTGDFAIIHFSCHGGFDDKGRYYLFPNDVKEGDLLTSAISVSNLRSDILETLPCGYLLILDACYSGMANPNQKGSELDRMRQLLENYKSLRLVFMSSKADQTSKEDDRWKNGAFTEAILSAFDNKEYTDASKTKFVADIDGNGLVSLYELDYYVKNVVRIITGGNQQVPQPYGDADILKNFYLIKVK